MTWNPFRKRWTKADELAFKESEAFFSSLLAPDPEQARLDDEYFASPGYRAVSDQIHAAMMEEFRRQFGLPDEPDPREGSRPRSR